MLEKKSISARLAKKVFTERLGRENIARGIMESAEGGFSRISKDPYRKTKSGLASTFDEMTYSDKKRYMKAKSKFEEARRKTLSSAEKYTKRKIWEENKNIYGKKNPTILDRAKKLFSSGENINLAYA